MELKSPYPDAVSAWEGEPAGHQADASHLFFGIDLRRILSIVRRNLLWIGGIVAIFLMLGVLFTMLATPLYTATSSVLVEENADQILEGSDVRAKTVSNDGERFLQTQVDVIKSRVLADRVVEANKLATSDRFFEAMGVDMKPISEMSGSKATPKGYAEYRQRLAAEELARGLSVELPAESRVVSIRFVSADPVLSARIADAYADNYIQNSLDRKFESTAYARRFLGNQLEEVRRRLETSERDLNQYSRAAGLIRVSGQSDGVNTEAALSVTRDTLTQLNTAAGAATAERVTAEDRWKTISGQPPLSIPDVLQNNAVQELIGRRSEVQAKLAEERTKHFDSYPTVAALKAQVADIDGRIQTIGTSIKRSIQLEYQAAGEKEKSLLERVSQLRSTALDEQDRGVQYNVLKRVADTNRATYDALLERYNQISAGAGAASNNISLVDRAQIPGSPSSPNLIINLMLALLLGLVAAAAFVIFRDYFDDTVRSPDDVEGKLGLPLLGLVPASDSPNEDLMEVKSSVSEAYHTLVTNLRYSTAVGFPHVVAITSSREGEGKSTTSYAVALDLARLGKRVLLIDCDLRRPTLHRLAADRNRAGLTSLLSGQATFDESIWPAEQENLFMMTALPIPAQPTILLGGPNMAKMIAEARSRFDVIVLDCPPMLGISDTAAIVDHTDGVVLLIDASSFQRGAVKGAVRRLRLINANILGAVLSKFKSTQADYNYYAYNYYQYGQEK